MSPGGSKEREKERESKGERERERERVNEIRPISYANEPPPSSPKNPIDQVVRPWTDIPWMPSSFVTAAHIFLTRTVAPSRAPARQSQHDIESDKCKQRPENSTSTQNFPTPEARPARVPTGPLPRGSDFGSNTRIFMYYFDMAP